MQTILIAFYLFILINNFEIKQKSETCQRFASLQTCKGFARWRTGDWAASADQVTVERMNRTTQ